MKQLPRRAFIFSLLIAAVFLRFTLMPLLELDSAAIRITLSIVVLLAGALFVLRGAAGIIEETTEVLSERTKLAGGMLQSLGTAFPDMVLGIVAALISLQLRTHDVPRAINFAVIAAATTFGSNIYNIAHAAWCVFRQNVANKRRAVTLMFPGFVGGGSVQPVERHATKPSIEELDTSLDILNALTLLTAAVAVSMVAFGNIDGRPWGFSGDLYQLIRPVGAAIFILCLAIMYHFRRTKRHASQIQEVEKGERYYQGVSTRTIWVDLSFAGVAILLSAEAMVHAVLAFGDATGTPFVVVGVLSGVIGCLGEMIVIHNYTIHPKGRIGDALVGVGMDNIVTTLGAAIVAIMGGIFLGGRSLILIFVVILAANSVLMWQISRLKNALVTFHS